MSSIPKTPEIPEDERTALMAAVLEIICLQNELIQELRDEIARLKGGKPKPKIKPSALEKHPEDKAKKGKDGKRPGSAKRKKTDALFFDDVQLLELENVPPGSTFKGCEEFPVQGLLIRRHNVLYLRERWTTPEGKNITAALPEEIRILGGHFDPSVHQFILYQYYHCHVTQPLILEQLLEFGIDISAGQVNRIITEDKELFHKEKDEILRVGLRVSGYVNVDDTGARHQGRNGYCTHIGNEMFAWFHSTDRKSRINFLELLRAGNNDYVLNDTALEYMNAQKLPKTQLKLLGSFVKTVFKSEGQWKAFLDSVGLTKKRHVRIAEEGALLGSLHESGSINPDLIVLSDDAGQFNVLFHALCWIHAERPISKLVGFNDAQRKAVAEIRSQIWEFYRDLKAYKQTPGKVRKKELEERFDEIFRQRTCYASLNQALKRIHKNKSELLLVLERPEIPLHNNASETDIREYAKKRNISGSTRSDAGRRGRDTFATLKKTSRKLKVKYWAYLYDRLTGKNSIRRLADLIIEKAQELQIGTGEMPAAQLL